MRKFKFEIGDYVCITEHAKSSVLNFAVLHSSKAVFQIVNIYYDRNVKYPYILSGTMNIAVAESEIEISKKYLLIKQLGLEDTLE